MTQDDEKKPRTLGLSTAQVSGSALAAMSGAFFASWLGTTGTLIGAALGSVIATVGSAIYAHSLRRTSAAVRRTADQVRSGALRTGAIPTPDPDAAADGPVPDPNAPGRGEPRPGGVDEAEPAPGRLAVLRARVRTGSSNLPWPKTILASVGVLVVALAGITMVEAVTGKPIASLLGRNDTTGTTVGNVVRNDSPQVDEPQAPERNDDPAPDEEPAPSEAPDEPAEEPAAPDDTPSEVPEVPPTETEAPAPTEP